MIFCKLKRKISSGSLQKRKIKTRDAATPSPGDENPDKICDNHEQPRSRSWTAPAAQFRCVVVVVTVLWPVRTHVRSRKEGRPETKFPTSRKLSADESAAANCDPLKSNRVRRRSKRKTDFSNPLAVDGFVSRRKRTSAVTHKHTRFNCTEKRRLINNNKNSVITPSAWC